MKRIYPIRSSNRRHYTPGVISGGVTAFFWFVKYALSEAMDSIFEKNPYLPFIIGAGIALGVFAVVRVAYYLLGLMLTRERAKALFEVVETLFSLGIFIWIAMKSFYIPQQ